MSARFAQPSRAEIKRGVNFGVYSVHAASAGIFTPVLVDSRTENGQSCGGPLRA
jgi:hypothetical protein